MADLKDTPESLISAVRDIMMKNQNLYQQDIERQYAQYSTVPTPEVEVPDPAPEAQEFDTDNLPEE